MKAPRAAEVRRKARKVKEKRAQEKRETISNGNSPSTSTDSKNLSLFSLKTPHAGSQLLERTHRGAPRKLKMIEVVLNDRLGKKVRVKCNEDDTVGDLKKLAAAQTGTRPDKIRLQKWNTVFKDHITLADYEIHDGMSLEMYYN